MKYVWHKTDLNLSNCAVVTWRNNITSQISKTTGTMSEYVCEYVFTLLTQMGLSHPNFTHKRDKTNSAVPKALKRTVLAWGFTMDSKIIVSQKTLHWLDFTIQVFGERKSFKLPPKMRHKALLLPTGLCSHCAELSQKSGEDTPLCCSVLKRGRCWNDREAKTQWVLVFVDHTRIENSDQTVYVWWSDRNGRHAKETYNYNLFFLVNYTINQIKTTQTVKKKTSFQFKSVWNTEITIKK